MTVASPADFDEELRAAAVAWLDRVSSIGTQTVSRGQLETFEFQGVQRRLIGTMQGIWKPRDLPAALSFVTGYTPPGARPKYEDNVGSDGLSRYKWEGTDPRNPRNVALRQAMVDGRPLLWFIAIAPGDYLPRYPVWLIGEEPTKQQFVVAVDQGQRAAVTGSGDEAQRRYVERLTRLRLHQPVFRSRVLFAYGKQCSVCRLRHVPLLDAAHIVPDSDPDGLPVVPNGLAMCKIHHAAYDADIIGVRPDLTVDVRADILAEIDGPMLRHGLQEMRDVKLLLPRARDARPDAVRLERRYEQFLHAS